MLLRLMTQLKQRVEMSREPNNLLTQLPASLTNVTPAQAGVHLSNPTMDSGLRRDEILILYYCFYLLFYVILIYT